MIQPETFKTISVFISELKVSRATFYRLCKKEGITPPGKLLSPQKQHEIKLKLGMIVSPTPS
jgi:hypothetical protein